jgi:hypothetical protein
MLIILLQAPVSRLKTPVWTRLVWASSGRENWTDVFEIRPHGKFMETKTIMEHFETLNLIFLRLVCVTFFFMDLVCANSLK